MKSGGPPEGQKGGPDVSRGAFDPGRIPQNSITVMCLMSPFHLTCD